MIETIEQARERCRREAAAIIKAQAPPPHPALLGESQKGGAEWWLPDGVLGRLQAAGIYRAVLLVGAEWDRRRSAPFCCPRCGERTDPSSAAPVCHVFLSDEGRELFAHEQGEVVDVAARLMVKLKRVVGSTTAAGKRTPSATLAKMVVIAGGRIAVG